MILLLLKVTLLLGLALLSQSLLRRSSAAIRHFVCAYALAGTLLLPLSLLLPSGANAFRIDAAALVSASQTALDRTAHWPVPTVMTIVWAAGAALLVLRIGTGYGALSRLLRKATPFLQGRAAPVFLADVSVPVVSGLFRPVILLPRAAAFWSGSQLAAALAHELQHVGRKDLWTMFAGHLACAIYWFHPMVWTVARRMRHEQESACDDAVLAAGFDPASYAEALLAAARNITSTRLLGCYMLTVKTLKFRIARLFDSGLARIPSRAGLRAAAVISAAAILAVAGLAADNRVYRMADGIAPPKVLDKINPDYTKKAREKKISGTVELNMVIGSDGLAHQIKVVRGLPMGMNGKAIDAVRKWHFQPGTKDGEPVNVRATIDINFRLD